MTIETGKMEVPHSFKARLIAVLDLILIGIVLMVYTSILVNTYPYPDDITSKIRTSLFISIPCLVLLFILLLVSVNLFNSTLKGKRAEEASKLARSWETISSVFGMFALFVASCIDELNFSYGSFRSNYLAVFLGFYLFLKIVGICVVEMYVRELGKLVDISNVLANIGPDYNSYTIQNPSYRDSDLPPTLSQVMNISVKN